MIDVTRPGTKPTIGSRHVIAQAIEDIGSIFTRMSFEVAEGPEVDDEWHNFDSLNVPDDHPARDMQDTFWVKGLDKMVLRTQTSNTQVRYMENNKPPIRIVVPGRVFRNESTDATHEAQFHQCEGLVVGDNISLANLKGTLVQFLQEFMDDEALDIRFRPGYFPFVEPGVEIDFSCFKCEKGKPDDNCNVCKGSGWIEVGGAGVTHRNVLESGGINPDKYQAFAFGMGVERLVMLKYGVTDIRDFYDGDIPFLKQFKK